MVSDKVRTLIHNAKLLSHVCVPGQITLSKLRLKKGALDKFRLPVDVIDGAFISTAYLPPS